MNTETRKRLNAALNAADAVLNSPKARQVRKEASERNRAWLAKEQGNQATKLTDNDVANLTAKNGLLAQADAADLEAREHERRASEAMATANSASHDRDIYNHYSGKARDYRAHAEMFRARADAHRRAAATLA